MKRARSFIVVRDFREEGGSFEFFFFFFSVLCLESGEISWALEYSELLRQSYRLCRPPKAEEWRDGQRHKVKKNPFKNRRFW